VVGFGEIGGEDVSVWDMTNPKAIKNNLISSTKMWGHRRRKIGFVGCSYAWPAQF